MSVDAEDQGDAAAVALPHRDQWRSWLAGFTAGVATGRREANQEWTDTTTLACRTALAGGGVAHAELERRRTTYRIPARTAEQIRAEAAWSLRRWERQIRRPPDAA